MGKKRTYRKVFSEIIFDLAHATDAQWEELFSLSRSFLHLDKGRRFANPDFPKVGEKVPGRDDKSATESSDWFLVAMATEQHSPAWNLAVENLLKNARESEHILYRWNQLYLILPENHPRIKEVRKRTSTIRRERRERKESLVV